MSSVEGGGTKKRRARGEGGIRLRPDGRWEATLDLGAEGTRRRRKFIYSRTKAEVRKALAEARRQQDEGMLITGRPPTVAQFLDAWLASVKGNVRHKTYVSYEGTVRLHINPWIGRARVDRLTPVEVQGPVTCEAARGRSARMLQYRLQVLRIALNKAAVGASCRGTSPAWWMVPGRRAVAASFLVQTRRLGSWRLRASIR